MLGSVHGYTRCPDCGMSVPTAKLASEEHECDAQSVVAHQTLKARAELVHLEREVANYASTPRAQRLLAFARWCDANGR